ncbi:hypothetical protein ABT025_18715 [Streptomyces sp. NPDC002809]|uniref:hypothetical protein n=1 Tax=Streptomyces sp. NPDC002809 TaxID=3154433 RepID=UPI00332CAE50
MLDTTPTTDHRALLRQAETYLTVTHDHAGRHDTIGMDLTCGGCQLRTRLTTALTARQVPGTTDQQPTTADKAAALDMAPTEYRQFRHDAAVEQIREAAGGLLAETGLRVMDALEGTTDQQPETTPTTAEVIRDRVAERQKDCVWIEVDGAPMILPDSWPDARTLIDAIHTAAGLDGTEAVPADRAAVLREAADAALTMPTPDCAEMSSLTSTWRAGLWAAVDHLRRLADEAQQPETEAGGPCPHCRHISCRDRTPCNAILSATALDLARCPCTGQPTADQPDTEAHQHTWVTALDGDDLPALDEHGHTRTHCGTCGTKRTPDERREPHPTEADMAHALTLLNHRPAADRPDTETEATKPRRCAHTDALYGQCTRAVDDHDLPCEFEHERCTCGDAGDAFVPAGHYADCPQAAKAQHSETEGSV